MKNFKELRIWQKGMDIAVNCFKIVKDFPAQERFGLALQITKSGVQFLRILPKGAVVQVKKTIVVLLKYH